MKSIKTKLVVYFSILILVISAVFGFISLDTASDAVVEEAEKGLEQLAFEGARLTQSRIETQSRTLETIGGIPDILSMDWEVQQPILETQLQRTNFLALAVVTPDGTAYYSDGTTAQLGDRSYVKKAFGGEANVSDLIVSSVTNDIVLMYAAPIERDGNVVGVLIGRRDGNALSNITDDMAFGEKGYAYMINDLGTVVAHPNRERVISQWNPIEEAKNDDSLKVVAEHMSKVLEEKRGINTYHFEGNSLYSAYAPIEGSNWIIVTVANEGEVLSAIPGLKNRVLLTSLIILAFGILASYFIGNSIAKPIISTVAYAKKIAELDITDNVNEEFKKREDEIGSLALAFQLITENLREFIKQVAEASEQVSSSSEELTATSQQSSMAAEEVARAIEEIAKSATEQAKDTEQGVAKTDELSKIIEENLKDMDYITKAMKQLTTLKDEGVEIIKELTIKTSNSNGAIQTIYESTKETNESAARIGAASRIIENISEQTNLLALNAAIEAARAGEAGKGFAVVADEIRDLAEQSTRSVKEIDEMLNKLQGNSRSAVDIMQNVLGIITEQVESVDLTEIKFRGISDEVEAVKAIVNRSVVSVESMDKAKNELAGIMQNLAAVAQENAAGTEEASASVEEQTASMVEISSSSEALAQLAMDMQKIITKFKY